MAKVLPRSSFQKLGLAAASLRSAMSSLSSNLTSMRTESSSHVDGGRQSMTRRIDLEESKPDDVAGTQFKIFQFVAKFEWDITGSGWIQSDKTTGMCFLGVARKYFGKGVERAAFDCNEVKRSGDGGQFYRSGPRLVAKEYLYEEHHKKSLEMYSSAGKIQAMASLYANLFNAFVGAHPHWISSWNVYFIKCCIYRTRQCEQDTSGLWKSVEDGQDWILTEPELEGKYTKWNNNAGMVYIKPSPEAYASFHSKKNLGAIQEESEEEEDDENGKGNFNPHWLGLNEYDVIQAFSHFTLIVSKGDELVCDLQGVHNVTDGFTLTDPTINSAKGKGTRGLTDRGQEGIDKFMESHVCSDLCHWLLVQDYHGLGISPRPTPTRRSPSQSNRRRSSSKSRGHKDI